MDNLGAAAVNCKSSRGWSHDEVSMTAALIAGKSPGQGEGQPVFLVQPHAK
jgi:hypothetical protein